MWAQFCFILNMQSGSETPKPALRKKHIGSSQVIAKWAVRLRDSKTCTEEKAYWLIPGYSQVEYKEIKDIDFSAPKTIKKRLNDMAIGEEQVSFKRYSTYPSPSDEEKRTLLRELITQVVNQQFYQFYQGLLKNTSLQ